MTNELLYKIEESIGNIFSVRHSDILGKSKKGACVKARHLSIYILHRDFKVTYRTLVSRYSISDRMIRWICQRWDYYISTIPEFRGYYQLASESTSAISLI